MYLKQLKSLGKNSLEVSDKLDRDDELIVSVYTDYIDFTSTCALTLEQVKIVRDHLNEVLTDKEQ